MSHPGNSAAGDFCCSLNLTDIYTGWTETQAVLGKSQEAVRARGRRSARPCRFACAASIRTMLGVA
ncbi:MAG TPA: hypothetical protein VKU44_11565 [Terriglobia bacterium]|nr:hypothetical protein [Terriglobia bacterium]